MAIGRLINRLAVTLPCAGVLVVIDAHQHLGEFAQQFAGNSIALVAFFTAYGALQDHDRLLTMTGAWRAFAATAAILRLARRSSHQTQQPADSST